MQNLTRPLIDTHETSSPSNRRGLAWLALTIGCEISGTVLLKRGLDDIRICVLAYILYFVGLTLFTVALRSISLSIAYSTWCALGIMGVTLASKILYDEEISFARWVCILGTVPLIIGMYIV